MLTRDAMLVGQGLYFELWDEARWNERRDEWLAGGVADGRPAGRASDAVALSRGSGGARRE